MSQALSRGSLIDCELGHYRIVEKIGEGGMGEVFRAHDRHLGHDVALKVLPPGTDPRSRQLFRKEAHALSQLNHPNIVTVLDFDTQDNIDFLVMEYVPGLALDEKLCQGTLREKEILNLGIQLAEGLVAAHAQGVIHRDLKPGNLRLTRDDRLKILDFGLAWSAFRLGPLASTASIDGLSDFSGTLPYMATEQLAGQAVDARTDIYAAGAVLYELYTGHAPFQQKLLTALVEDILHTPPVAPGHLKPGISSQLEGVILKCLEKDPEKRYQSAQEFLQELKEIAAASSPARDVRPSKWRRYYAAALLTCLAIAGLTATFAYYAKQSRNRAQPQNPPSIESLAVLPFSNLSGDPQQDYLADGITDFLITDLGQMHAFQRVISRTSVMRYKTANQPVRQIARQLNVDAIIEGSVLRSEQKLQVTVRLVNAADDRQIWSRSYESQFRDLLTLQRELALGIAKEMRVDLGETGPAYLSEAHPVEPAAQDAYLKALYLSAGTTGQRVKARQYLEQTIQIDPSYAPAYARLADSYWNDITLPAQEAMPKARSYALKAISLDDTLAHAHTALATVEFYGDWDWPGADREYQRALQLNPNDAEAHRMYSVFLAAMARADEALAQVLSAQALDPLYNDSNTTAGWDLYCARRYDEALKQCEKALELAPNHESSHSCLSYAYLGKGEYHRAIDEGSKAWTLSGKETVWAVLLGRAYALGGEPGEADKILTQLLARSRQAYVPPYFVAILYASLERKELALQWLEKAYSERDLYLAWIKVDPAVDSLRTDPRFQVLSNKMGFAP
jgi:eukaryotic-like serine/threonine-protein kinase